MRFYMFFLSFIIISCASPAPLHNIPMDLPQGDTLVRDTGADTRETVFPDIDSAVKMDTRDADNARDGIENQDETMIPDIPADIDVTDTHQGKNYPLRQCEVVLKYAAPAGTVSVSIPGEWNNWDKTADAMQKDANGIFVKKITGNDEIQPGEWAYKFLEDGKNWVMDPNNPLSKWSGEPRFENSKLVMPDCNLPVVKIDKTNVAQRHIHIEFSVFRGLDGKAVNKVSVTQDGNTVKFSLDANGTGIIDFDAPANGKYDFMVIAKSGRKKAEKFVPVWVQDKAFSWQDAIMYFPMTDRFMDGDTSNDAPATCLDATNKANWLGGDFAGIKQKIDAGYFNDLGVNTLWLGPVWNNPDGCYPGALDHKYTAYHGYFPMYYTKIEEHYGTMDELKEMIRDAHAHGIRIVLDLPANHVFQDSTIFSAHRDWFHNGKVSDKPLICSDNDNWNEHPIDCWFQPYLPDFDYTNNDAVDFVTDAAVNFTRETGVDGFRIDAVKHMVPNFVKTLRYKISHEIETPDTPFYMVGETFVGEWGGGTGEAEELIKKYVSADQLNGQFDFPMYWAILKTFARDEGTFNDLADVLSQEQGYYGADAVMSTFIGNHDVPRFISHAAGDIADQWGNGSKQQGWDNPPAQPSDPDAYKRLKCAFAFTMCTPGIPLIYYGDEVAMPGAGDPDNRRMMQFEGLNDGQKGVKAALSLETAFRKDHVATKTGTPVILDKGDEFMTLGMKGNGDAVVCVFNQSGKRELDINLQGLPGLESAGKLRDRLSGQAYTVDSGKVSVSMDGNTCLMLEAQ